MGAPCASLQRLDAKLLTESRACPFRPLEFATVGRWGDKIGKTQPKVANSCTQTLNCRQPPGKARWARHKVWQQIILGRGRPGPDLLQPFGPLWSSLGSLLGPNGLNGGLGLGNWVADG